MGFGCAAELLGTGGRGAQQRPAWLDRPLGLQGRPAWGGREPEGWWASVAREAKERPAGGLNGNQWQSMAINDTQRHSKAINGNQW